MRESMLICTCNCSAFPDVYVNIGFMEHISAKTVKE